MVEKVFGQFDIEVLSRPYIGYNIILTIFCDLLNILLMKLQK